MASNRIRNKKKREDTQKDILQNRPTPQRGAKVPKELDAAAITMCANLFNVDAMRKTKKRNFDEIAAILAENITVPTMRQWTGPLRLGIRNISRTTDKTEWASKALAAALKK